MSEAGKGAGGGTEGVTGGAAQPALRRLVDEPAADPTSPSGWAVSLLRRTPPYRPPVGRKQRVRLGLGQGGKRRRSPLLRPAIAGVVLIGCGAAASAALGRWPELVAQAYHRLLTTAPAPSPLVAEARPRRSTFGQTSRASSSLSSPSSFETASAGVEAAPPSLAAPAVPPSLSMPAPALSHPQLPARVPSSAASPREAIRASSASWRPRRAPAPPVATATEDTSPVLEAMRALRVDGNPARARRLLAGYLERHPNGTLAEEALAMSIEAAVARGDGDATALARRYLRRYPAGHFSALARQTLDEPASAPR